MTISEGELRAATAGSQQEASKYPPAEEIHRREVIEEDKTRQKFPKPLRDLLAAEEKPDDSDLVAYKDYVNRFRDKPDPALLAQLLAHAHEDTVRYSMMLEALMLNDNSPGARKWDPAKRKQALGFLIDALRATKDDDALYSACIVALKSLGGGKLKLTTGGASVDLEVIPQKDGESTIGSHADHNPELTKKIQEEFRRRLKE